MEGRKYNLQQPCAKIGRKLSALVVAHVLVRVGTLPYEKKKYTRYFEFSGPFYHSFWTKWKTKKLNRV